MYCRQVGDSLRMRGSWHCREGHNVDFNCAAEDITKRFLGSSLHPGQGRHTAQMLQVTLAVVLVGTVGATLVDDCKSGLEQLQGLNNIELASRCRASFSPELCHHVHRSLGAQPWSSGRMDDSCVRFASAVAGQDMRSLEQTVADKNLSYLDESTSTNKSQVPQPKPGGLVGELLDKLREGHKAMAAKAVSQETASENRNTSSESVKERLTPVKVPAEDGAELVEPVSPSQQLLVQARKTDSHHGVEDKARGSDIEESTIATPNPNDESLGNKEGSETIPIDQDGGEQTLTLNPSESGVPIEQLVKQNHKSTTPRPAAIGFDIEKPDLTVELETVESEDTNFSQLFEQSPTQLVRERDHPVKVWVMVGLVSVVGAFAALLAFACSDSPLTLAELSCSDAELCVE